MFKENKYMKKEKLRIIKVNPNYIEYLRKFDSKVQFNQIELKKDNKPFLGVLFSIHNKKYYVPISSANTKEKLKVIYDKYKQIGKSPIDIIFITDKSKKLLSVLNLNNMIPIVESSIIEYDITKDKNASLLMKEYKYCEKNKKEIKNRAIKIYNIVRLHNSQSLEKRCCNFELLEKKSEDKFKCIKI